MIDARAARNRLSLCAVIHVLDRTVGRPRQQQARDRSFEAGGDMETALAGVREKLAVRLERHAVRSVISG
jgi:hypothetical protein